MAKRSFAELVVLDVLLHEGKSFSLFTVVLDCNGRAALNLSGLAFLVVLAVAQPLAQFVPRVDGDQRDLVGLSESL